MNLSSISWIRAPLPDFGLHYLTMSSINWHWAPSGYYKLHQLTLSSIGWQWAPSPDIDLHQPTFSSVSWLWALLAANVIISADLIKFKWSVQLSSCILFDQYQRNAKVHTLFFIRMDLNSFRLNILKFFPISAWKYS